MRVELHVVRGPPVDVAAWQGAFAELGLHATLPANLDLEAEGSRSVTMSVRVIAPDRWRLGEAVFSGEHNFALRCERCTSCEPYARSEPRSEIVFVAEGAGCVGAWLAAGTLSFASGRELVDRVRPTRIGPDDALFLARRNARAAALDGPRVFVHPDGRRLEVAFEDDAIETSVFLPDDPEPIVRRRPRAELDPFVAELGADGFAEAATRPVIPPLDVVEDMVDVWRRHDSTFDVDALAAPLRNATPEARAQIAEALTGLEIVWVRRPEGGMISDNVTMEARRARAHDVLLRPGALNDAALLLALRPREPFGRAHEARDLLCRRPAPPDVAFPALLSCIRTFRNPRNDLPGDAARALEAYRPLPDGLVEPLLALLEDPRRETSGAAASLLAGRAGDRRVFDALWARRDDKDEAIRLSVLRACEIRKDRATLPWLERQLIKRGWRARIEFTIAKVRGGV